METTASSRTIFPDSQPLSERFLSGFDNVFSHLLSQTSFGWYGNLSEEPTNYLSITIGELRIQVKLSATISPPRFSRDEIIALQLTENLQREDLNPIDLAKRVLSFFQARHPENQFDVDGLMAVLVSYMRSPDYLMEGVSATVAETIQNSGKSIQTLHRTLSLLKLGTLIQEAISAGNLPVSQGGQDRNQIKSRELPSQGRLSPTRPARSSATANVESGQDRNGGFSG